MKMDDSSIFKTKMDASSVFPTQYNHEFIHVGPKMDVSSIFKTKMDDSSVFKTRMDESSVSNTKMNETSVLEAGQGNRRMRPRNVGQQASLKPSASRAPGASEAQRSQ